MHIHTYEHIHNFSPIMKSSTWITAISFTFVKSGRYGRSLYSHFTKKMQQSIGFKEEAVVDVIGDRH